MKNLMRLLLLSKLKKLFPQSFRQLIVFRILHSFSFLLILLFLFSFHLHNAFLVFFKIIILQPIQWFCVKFLKIISFFVLITKVWPFIEKFNLLVHEIISQLVLNEELVFKSSHLILTQILLEFWLETLHLSFELRLLQLSLFLSLQLPLLLDLLLQFSSVSVLVIQSHNNEDNNNGTQTKD